MSLALLFCLAELGRAEGSPEYIGTWTNSGDGAGTGGECGTYSYENTLDIYQKISSAKAELYDARYLSIRKWKACDRVRDVKERVIVVVKGHEDVELHGMHPGWSPDILKRTGDTMTGEDAMGRKSTYTKLPTLQIEDRVDEVRANLAKKYHGERAESVIRTLSVFRTDGLTSDVDVWNMYSDSAMCVIDALRLQAVEKSLPFYELLSIVDPQVGGTDIEISQALDYKVLTKATERCLEMHEDALAAKLIDASRKKEVGSNF